jgi:hypothetical protein
MAIILFIAQAVFSLGTGALVRAELPIVAPFIVPSALPTSVSSMYYVNPQPTTEPQLLFMTKS